MKKSMIIMALLTGAAASIAQAAPARSDAQEAAVAFWTAGYTGADLAADNYGCAAPEVPEYSWANQQIRSLSRSIAKWRVCHEKFMTSLTMSGHADYRVPGGVLAVMRADERERAEAHLQAVHARVAAAAMDNAARIDGQHSAWLDATLRYVVAMNRGTDASNRLAALDSYARYDWLRYVQRTYRYSSQPKFPASR